MQAINDSFLSLEECRKENNRLSDGIDSCQLYFSLSKQSEEQLKDIINTNEQSISERDKIITAADGIIKGQKKEIRKLKTHKVLSILSFGILLGVIGYLLII